ncbi:Hypothetical predicted protein [Xyrichtys novacula]|uniref:Uncharacterized protein n=1 Tax=Xyrichtys novacula TaxID=13765 RepID=A0AAV1F5G1_XYRNO|nr:Hypothetical predicted protein [Xyrichtys novacula]
MSANRRCQTRRWLSFITSLKDVPVGILTRALPQIHSLRKSLVILQLTSHQVKKEEEEEEEEDTYRDDRNISKQRGQSCDQSRPGPARPGVARLFLSADDLWVSQERNGKNSSRLKSANNESSPGVMDGPHPGPFVCALRSPVSIVKETLLNMQS